MNQGSRIRVSEESHGRLTGQPPAAPSRVSEFESADSAGPQVLPTVETEGAAAGCGGSGDHGDGAEADVENEDVAMAESSGLKRGCDDDDFIAPNKPARVEPSPSESGLPLTNLFGLLQVDSMLHTDVKNPPSLYSDSN